MKPYSLLASIDLVAPGFSCLLILGLLLEKILVPQALQQGTRDTIHDFFVSERRTKAVRNRSIVDFMCLLVQHLGVGFVPELAVDYCTIFPARAQK